MANGVGSKAPLTQIHIDLSCSCTYRVELQSNEENVCKHVRRLVVLTLQDFLPFISRCLEAVFKPSALHIAFGRPGLMLDPLSSDSFLLDLDKIGAKLTEFLSDSTSMDQGVDMGFKSCHVQDCDKSDSNAFARQSDSRGVDDEVMTIRDTS